MPFNYKKNATSIYKESFATIRAEADLSVFTEEEEIIAVRMIHASGMVELAHSIKFMSNFAIEARTALERGAPILCDTKMVSEGITRARLPKSNKIICTIQDPRVKIIMYLYILVILKQHPKIIMFSLPLNSNSFISFPFLFRIINE